MTTKTSKCKRCHRTLTDPKSVAAGYGPRCAKRRAAEQRAAAVIASNKPAAVDKAIELIGDNGVQRIAAGLFLTTASDGSVCYETTSSSCTCTAGIYGRMCYHRVAAQLMIAAA